MCIRQIAGQCFSDWGTPSHTGLKARKIMSIGRDNGAGDSNGLITIVAISLNVIISFEFSCIRHLQIHWYRKEDSV